MVDPRDARLDREMPIRVAIDGTTIAKIDPDERVLLSVADVAEVLNVSARTVLRLVEQGELPAYRVGARLTRISSKDLDTFLDQRATRTHAGGDR